MARKNDPYIPLYAQDWLTNLKLKECSPAAHGLMISVMCLMHKSDDYGKLLLREKHKICRGKSDGKVLDFAAYLSKILPWTSEEIKPALVELLQENVLFFDGDFLVCGRMVRDGELSEKRSKSGKEGADVTNGVKPKAESKPKKGKNSKENFAAANQSANTEIEIDNENEISFSDSNGLLPIRNRGMQGGLEKYTERPTPEWYAALYLRFVSAYGETGRATKRSSIEYALHSAVDDCMDQGKMNQNEAATFLSEQAKRCAELDAKAGNAKRLNPETWLNEKCYQSQIKPEAVPTEKTKQQTKQDEIRERQERVAKQFFEQQKQKEAGNAH